MTRRAFDYYPTTAEGATSGLLTLAPCPFGGTVIECCSGQHHMTKVLRESCLFDRVITNDLVPSLEADFHEDARDSRVWEQVFPPVDWVITNPTFAGALPIVKNARRFARIGCAFYLRVTFWEPTYPQRRPTPKTLSEARGPFLLEHPPTGFMACSRISHTEDGGTDTATCGWFVWQHGDVPQWHRVLVLGHNGQVDTRERAPLLRLS